MVPQRSVCARAHMRRKLAAVPQQRTCVVATPRFASRVFYAQRVDALLLLPWRFKTPRCCACRAIRHARAMLPHHVTARFFMRRRACYAQALLQHHRRRSSRWLIRRIRCRRHVTLTLPHYAVIEDRYAASCCHIYIDVTPEPHCCWYACRR